MIKLDFDKFESDFNTVLVISIRNNDMVTESLLKIFKQRRALWFDFDG